MGIENINDKEQQKRIELKKNINALMASLLLLLTACENQDCNKEQEKEIKTVESELNENVKELEEQLGVEITFGKNGEMLFKSKSKGFNPDTLEIK